MALRSNAPPPPLLSPCLPPHTPRFRRNASLAPPISAQSPPARKLRVGFIGMDGQIKGHVSRILELGHETAPFLPRRRLPESSIHHPGQWRSCHYFRNGSLGDFCCHGFNLPVRALNLDYPSRIEISGSGLGLESFAKACTVHYHFPARGSRSPVKLHFYTGGDLPPEAVTARLRESTGSLPSTGCLMIGTKGQLQCGLWNSDGAIRMNDDTRFSWFGAHAAAKAIPESIPRSKGQIEEWIDAILGGPKVFSDFNHGAHLTEIGLASIVALRLQENIDWDGPAMKAPGHPEADAFINPTPPSKGF